MGNPDYVLPRLAVALGPVPRPIRGPVTARPKRLSAAPHRPRRDQRPLPSWLIFAVATSSIMARSLSGTGIGVQALSPSMKKTRPPELPSTLASAALSP